MLIKSALMTSNHGLATHAVLMGLNGEGLPHGFRKLKLVVDFTEPPAADSPP